MTAAKIVLNDFQRGKIPYYVRPPGSDDYKVSRLLLWLLIGSCRTFLQWQYKDFMHIGFSLQLSCLFNNQNLYIYILAAKQSCQTEEGSHRADNFYS